MTRRVSVLFDRGAEERLRRLADRRHGGCLSKTVLEAIRILAVTLGNISPGMMGEVA